MSKVTTLKGKIIDLGALREAHGATIALNGGSGRVTNARGDVLGRGGVVVKAKEEVIRDYYEKNPKAVSVSTVSLKDIGDEVMMTPAEAVAALESQIKPEPAKPVSKRKIKDTED